MATSWTYDANGWVLTDTGPNGTVTFTHDHDGQVTAVDHPTGTDEGYSFDVAGNRTSTGYSTTAGNRLASDGIYNYTYDNEGNRLTRTLIANGSQQVYTYDYHNRLIDVLFKNSSGTATQEASYRYDALDRVIARNLYTYTGGVGPAPVSSESYTYDGSSDNIAEVFDTSTGSPAATQRYLYGDDGSAIAEETIGGTTGWYLTDNQGSTREVVNASGTSLTSIDYDSFGNIRNQTGTYQPRFTYTGQQLDLRFGRTVTEHCLRLRRYCLEYL